MQRELIFFKNCLDFWGRILLGAFVANQLNIQNINFYINKEEGFLEMW